MTRLPDHLGVQRRPSEDRRIESVNFLTKLPGEATDRKGQFHVIESHRPSPFWINDSPLSAETDHPGWTGSKPFRTLGRSRLSGRRAVLTSGGEQGGSVAAGAVGTIDRSFELRPRGRCRERFERASPTGAMTRASGVELPHGRRAYQTPTRSAEWVLAAGGPDVSAVQGPFPVSAMNLRCPTRHTPME